MPQSNNSDHRRRSMGQTLRNINLGKDIDFAIGLTAAALAIDQVLQAGESKHHKASHLAKAGLGAAVTAGAYKMMQREMDEEHREKRRQHQSHHQQPQHMHRDMSPSPKHRLQLRGDNEVYHDDRWEREGGHADNRRAHSHDGEEMSPSPARGEKERDLVVPVVERRHTDLDDVARRRRHHRSASPSPHGRRYSITHPNTPELGHA